MRTASSVPEVHRPLQCHHLHWTGIPANSVKLMTPLDYLPSSNTITFSGPGHFGLDQSSAAKFTLLHTSGFLNGGKLIFFRLHASGKFKSKVCIAATFQLIKRGSMTSLFFCILSASGFSRAALMRGGIAGDVTTSNILLIGGYRGNWTGKGLDPASHACWFSLTWAYSSGQAGTRIASPEFFTIGSRFQSLVLSWTFERSSLPIRQLKLLLKSINIQPGSAILPNNLSSFASLLSSCSFKYFVIQREFH